MGVRPVAGPRRPGPCPELGGQPARHHHSPTGQRTCHRTPCPEGPAGEGTARPGLLETAGNPLLCEPEQPAQARMQPRLGSQGPRDNSELENTGSGWESGVCTLYSPGDRQTR